MRTISAARTGSQTTCGRFFASSHPESQNHAWPNANGSLKCYHVVAIFPIIHIGWHEKILLQEEASSLILWRSKPLSPLSLANFSLTEASSLLQIFKKQNTKLQTAGKRSPQIVAGIARLIAKDIRTPGIEVTKAHQALRRPAAACPCVFIFKHTRTTFHIFKHHIM